MSFSWSIPAFVPSQSPVPVDEGTRDLFGYDILFKAGDLQKSNGDYMRVGGLENLRQAIYRRLITRPGEFRFRPNYGVGAGSFVKKSMTQANLDALRSRIIDQLLQDKRITACDVTVSTETLNGQLVVKALIVVTAAGQKTAFQPFTFAEEQTP